MNKTQKTEMADRLGALRKHLEQINTLNRAERFTDRGDGWAFAVGQANGLAALALIELDCFLAGL